MGKTEGEDVGKEAGPPFTTADDKRIVEGGVIRELGELERARVGRALGNGVESNQVIDFGLDDGSNELLEEIGIEVTKEAEKDQGEVNVFGVLGSSGIATYRVGDGANTDWRGRSCTFGHLEGE